MKKLTIYGDFNCRLSYIASLQVDDLVERGLALVDWRAVEHDPTIPSDGRPFDQALAESVTAQIADAKRRGLPQLVLSGNTPTVLSNTAGATRALAGASPEAAPALRRLLFDSYWVQGRDIGDISTVDLTTRDREDPAETVLTRWRSAWLGIENPAVPLLMLPTGIVLRGVDALERLDILGSGGLAERRRRLSATSR